MKTGFIIIFMLSFASEGFCQHLPGEILPYKTHRSPSVFSSPNLSIHFQKSLCGEKQWKEDKLLVPASVLPAKLPMFCAMEKKLNDLTNIWIKIRLPEKP